MGCFSWMFADTDNTAALRLNHPGYLLLPDGTFLHEPSYEGYGDFAGQDAFDLVADWNREYLAQHPDFIIKPYGYIKDPTAPSGFCPDEKKVSDFLWYAAYADPTKTREEVEAAWKEAVAVARAADPETEISGYCEWRGIGIDIAGTDECNAALPYPIKVCTRGDIPTETALQRLPASKGDDDQGMGCDDDDDNY